MAAPANTLQGFEFFVVPQRDKDGGDPRAEGAQ